MLKQCGQYEAYRATGIEQDTHGAFPVVVWVFTDPVRADKVRSSLLRSPRLTPELYRLTTFDALTQRATELLQ